MYRRGFTLIELLIVIAIAGILLILGVVNLRSTQANGRDEQRKGDIANIALNLEAYYTSGNGTSNTIGRYPSTDLIGQETTALPNLDPQSLIAPNDTSSSLVKATNDTQTTAGIRPLPTLTTSDYVYQPLYFDGTSYKLCDQPTEQCQKFNLYYESEVTKTVQMVTSKNQ